MTAGSGVLRRRRAGPALSVAGNGVVLTGAVLAGLLAGEGWLYVLRGAGWLDAGPNVGDSLPLLALAGADGQPLLRVLVSWLLAGAMAAVVMVRLPAPHRAALAGALCLVLLLFASQASYALVRNLRLSDVITTRAPGAGPWVQALAFAVGCALPGRAVAWTERIRRVERGRSAAAARERGVRGGEDRDAAEHDHDRRDVNRQRGRGRSE
jgi:hypothetical protein